MEHSYAKAIWSQLDILRMLTIGTLDILRMLTIGTHRLSISVYNIEYYVYSINLSKFFDELIVDTYNCFLTIDE